MKPPAIAYADCFSGVSGDMFLGALLHCGLPEEVLRRELAGLALPGWSLTLTPCRQNGIGAVKVDVADEGGSDFRHLSAIRDILQRSSLKSEIVSRSLAVFMEIARAEAKVHDIAIEDVHFHEVGAIDTIIDVVGTVAGLHHLGIDRLHAAPLPMPRGFVRCAHGLLPLPAPAVCEILRDVPSYGVDIDRELVTPTGAALLKVLSSGFGPMPPMTIARSGYGAGSHAAQDGPPNLFRLIVGTPFTPQEQQEVEVIDTHLDDWSPESFPYLCDRLFAAGALDVSLTPIHMKKGRPGFLVRIVAPPHLSLDLRHILFTETSAIGVRFRREQRHTLPRSVVEIETPWGRLLAKRIGTPGGTRVYPEYEECRRIAQAQEIPLQQVYDFVRNEANRS